MTLLRGLVAERPFDAANYVALAGLASRTSATEALSVARQMAAVDGLQEAGTLLEGDLLLQAGKRDDALQHFNRAAKAGMVPAALLRVRVLDAMDRGSDADARGRRAAPLSEDVAVVGPGRAAATARHAARAAELLQRLATRSRPTRSFVMTSPGPGAGRPGRVLWIIPFSPPPPPHNAPTLCTLGMALVKAGKRRRRPALG
ncbi:MAG: hypothetical protein IPM99_06755 [Rubrivivax sp.]|nr:hypothetical protein [Rubrivivax sp.]